MKIISLFSGCGAMDLGFKKVGFETILATDVWNKACNSLEINKISKEIICEDIKNISFKKFRGKIDGVIGGPPCQPFSQTRHYLIDKKKGFQDDISGYTVPEFIRAIREVNPTFFVFENVDGFSYKTHKLEFDFFKEELELLGYRLSYKVLNLANFGIPQTRKRFICVGTKIDKKEFIFPSETHTNKIHDNPQLLPWINVKECIKEFDNVKKEEKNQKPGGKHHELFLGIPPGDNYLYYTEKRGCKNPKFEWKSRYWTFLLKLTPDRPSWTIQANSSENQGPFHWKNRFLRIEEIKRIQTIDDNFIINGNFKDQWKQIGNALPTKMAKIIAKEIKMQFY